MSTQTVELSRGPGRVGVALFGPAIVASVAYVDPGNFATNFGGGAEHGYLLVWVIVLADLMAMLVQYLASKLGLATAQSLPEVCREQYSLRWNAVLWLQAEVVAMATDLAEFTGAAVGLNLLFGISLLPAGLVTAAVAFAILGLQRAGYRPFELAVMALLAFVAVGFVVDFFGAGRQSYSGIAGGLVPKLAGGDTVELAVGIIGATVMPHVIYVHSALQRDRALHSDRALRSDRLTGTDATRPGRRTLLRYNRYDCILGLGVAGLVNLSMLCIAAALFHHPGLTGVADLGAVHAHLATMVGGGAALVFAVALVASGLSSSSVGTYAGQVVMAGFMHWRVPLLVRRAVTMVPSLLILGIGVNTTQALIYSQVVLSFGIPFALVPLTVLTARRQIMGDMVNRASTTYGMWATTGVITALNIYLLIETVRRL